MKKVIIGVHGLGNKPPKYLLKKWWKDAINEGFKKNNIKNELPTFDLIYWADILYDKPLNKWEKNIESPYFLDEPYVKAPKHFVVEDISLRKKVMDYLSTQLNSIFLNNDKTLNFGFISDFILHNFFKDLEVYYKEECKDENDNTCKAKNLIRKRFIEVLTKYADYEITIIAHSMGSIIAFDVLTFLLPELNINTLITIGSPLGLPIVVSKIASEHRKNHNCKSYMTTPPGVRKNWFNMADIQDKVALNYILNDDFSPNLLGIAPTDILVVNDFVVNEHKNPHKSFGYLRTPEMSTILNEFINKDKNKLTMQIINTFEHLFEHIKVQRDMIKNRLNID